MFSPHIVSWKICLAHYGLVTPYGNINLGHHWRTQWLVIISHILWDVITSPYPWYPFLHNAPQITITFLRNCELNVFHSVLMNQLLPITYIFMSMVTTYIVSSQCIMFFNPKPSLSTTSCIYSAWRVFSTTNRIALWNPKVMSVSYVALDSTPDRASKRQ